MVCEREREIERDTRRDRAGERQHCEEHCEIGLEWTFITKKNIIYIYSDVCTGYTPLKTIFITHVYGE